MDGLAAKSLEFGSPAFGRQSDYDYAYPLDVNRVSNTEPLLAALVATRAFRRLRHVRFLGGIDYLLVPRPNGRRLNRRYTRYQHSLGVARLALLYAHRRKLSTEDRRLACAAALLHDIGHAPLSHTLEPVFEEAFGLNHHKAAEQIILGRVELGRGVSQVLSRFQINPARLLAILRGKEDPFDGFFSGPINFDTIEGILRSCQYMSCGAACPDPIAVTCAAIDRATKDDLNMVDSFWACKGAVYAVLIRSRLGILADHVCQTLVRRSLGRLGPADFLSTEEALFRKVPDFRNRFWQAAPSALSDNPIRYKMRSFDVDTNANFFDREDHNRYRQFKEDRTLAVSAPQAKLLVQSRKGRFDVRSISKSEGLFREDA